MRLLITYIIILVLCTQVSASYSQDVKMMYEAKDKLREYIPELSPLEKKFSQDPNKLLGLATIYSRFAPSFEYTNKSIELYRKVVVLDPNNIAARTAFVGNLFGEFTSQRIRVLKELERVKKYAQRENLNKIEIQTGSILYKWLCEKDQEKVIISDFNDIQIHLNEKLDRDLQSILSELKIAEELAPNNAIYNYFRAQLYFYLERDNEGLTEFIKGTEKQSYTNFRVEITNSCGAVLRETEYPHEYIDIIVNNIPVPTGISLTKVFDLAQQDYEKGEFEKSAEIYRAAIHYMNQLKNTDTTNKTSIEKFTNRFEKEARDQLNKIQQK